MEPKKSGWSISDLLARLSDLLARLAVSAVCGFTVMIIAGWTAIYFEALPSEPQASQYATYLFLGVTLFVLIFGMKAATWVALGVPLFLVCVAFVVTWQECVAIAAQPDLNGDGNFTIRDVISAALRIITATGGWYSDMIFGPITYETGFVRFFEISVGVGIWITRIFLTIFYWFMAISWYRVIKDIQK